MNDKMFNTINLNRGENNSMNSSLTFHWKAVFPNGKIIYQFDKNGKENPFKIIKENLKDLILFSIYNKKENKLYIVDLIKGMIYSNNILSNNSILLNFKEKRNNIRLIYFRRNRVTIGENDLKEKSHIINYFLGFQYNDIKGYNRKVLIQIDEKGNFIIR